MLARFSLIGLCCARSIPTHGGLVVFGLLGLFVGPVILGVAYTPLQHWMADAKR